MRQGAPAAPRAPPASGTGSWRAAASTHQPQQALTSPPQGHDPNNSLPKALCSTQQQRAQRLDPRSRSTKQRE